MQRKQKKEKTKLNCYEPNVTLLKLRKMPTKCECTAGIFPVSKPVSYSSDYRFVSALRALSALKWGLNFRDPLQVYLLNYKGIGEPAHRLLP